MNVLGKFKPSHGPKTTIVRYKIKLNNGFSNLSLVIRLVAKVTL